MARVVPIESDEYHADELGDPKSVFGRQQGLLLCHRALICFGDLMRYRELYSESAAKANKSGTASLQSAANRSTYARAAECYHQARLLVPDDGQFVRWKQTISTEYRPTGNPSNQLAVLASYGPDTLASAYHYYRALSVRSSFPTARHNLKSTLEKSLESSTSPEHDVSTAIVHLHARIFLQIKFVSEPYKISKRPLTTHMQPRRSRRALSAECNALLGNALSIREVSSDNIVKIVVLAIASWWDTRMSHGKCTTQDLLGIPDHSFEDEFSSPHVEPLALAHVLRVLTTLFSIAADQVPIAVQSKAGLSEADNLATKISPVLRRALPALRISSKWLLRHVEYTYPTSIADSTPKALWTAHVQLANALSDAFPMEKLPQLPTEAALEEDVDMAGFLPLGGSGSGGGQPVRSPFIASHPNEEHLMRVAGLLADFQLLASGRVRF